MSLLDNLLTFGFSPSEAKTYLSLLEQGELSVGEISKRAELSRAGTHEALNAILSRGLVEVRREGRNTYYKGAHPNVLYGMLEEKKRDEERKTAEMSETVRNLIGMFNVSESKPGVRFFEGIDGVRQVLWDSLTSTEMIYTIGDMEIMLSHYATLNEEYIKERTKRGIQKKVITRDTPFIRNALTQYDTSVTDIRLIPDGVYSIKNTITEIYMNKVSFTTLHNEHLSAVIIDTQQIATAQKCLFDLLWNQATAA